MSDQQSNESPQQQGDQQPGKKRRRRRRGRRNTEGGTPGEQGAEDVDGDGGADDDGGDDAPESGDREGSQHGDAEGEGDGPSKRKRRRKKKRDGQPGQGEGQPAQGEGQPAQGGEGQQRQQQGQRQQQKKSGEAQRREKREQQQRERAERPAQPSVLQRRLNRIRSENDGVDDDAPVVKAAPVVVNATTVDGYVSAHRGWQREVLSILRDLIRTAAPGCEEGILWSQPVFSMNGPMVYIKAFSDHVNIGFWRGNELDDPADMLVGDLPKMRHYTMRNVNDVKRDILENMVRQAAKLNRDKGDPTQ